MIPTRLLAFSGLVLSLYAVYVEHKVSHVGEDETFQALCDIEAIGASCSAVFQRPEGKLLSFFGLVPPGHALDVPNAVLGAAYYALLLALPVLAPGLRAAGAFTRAAGLLATRVIAAIAFGTTVVLAYCLTFVVYDLCVLCWTSHIINAVLVYRLVWRNDDPLLLLLVAPPSSSGSGDVEAKAE